MADSTTASPTVSTSVFTPTGTRDSAPGSAQNPQNGNDDDNSGGVPMASYYFVFLILTLCVIAAVIFLNFRRRRKRRLQGLLGQDGMYATNVAVAHGGRRYWPRGWASTNVSREEGLNEHGEAPPPYMPKSFANLDGQGSEGRQEGGARVAVPMHTLSRDDAGLRPPQYEEGGHDDMMRDSRHSVNPERL